MRRKIVPAIGVMCAVALMLTACGKADSGGSGTGPIKLGLMAPLSGAASAAFTGAQGGAKARLAAYKEDNGKCASRGIDLVTADDQSSPQGDLTAAQKLVQQDKVYGILEVTPYFFGATQYLTTAAKDVPVFGGAFDSSPQWLKNDNNLFGALPSVPDYSKVYAPIGEYFKSIGGTKIAAVAYANRASQDGMNQTLRSVKAAGLQQAYVNDTVPFGSTDVGAIVLGIIHSGADVLYLPINADTAFAVVAGLHQAGYKLKSVVSATGYGADLLDSPPAIQAGQGISFQTATTPNELNTPATQRLAKALKDHAASKSGVPSFSQAQGWLAADLFLHGLELAGCDASSKDVIAKLRTDTTWNAGGLYPLNADFSKPSSDKQCLFLSTLEGNGFKPEPKASPLCGNALSGG
jgi:branched-chain amino acid transport system substrate-binding protein